MKFWLLLLAIASCCCAVLTDNVQKPLLPIISGCKAKRVAVIGAGAAGASASFFLREAFPVNKNSSDNECIDLDLTVYEASDRIGGRAKIAYIPVNNGSEYIGIEIGASIFGI